MFCVTLFDTNIKKHDGLDDVKETGSKTPKVINKVIIFQNVYRSDFQLKFQFHVCFKHLILVNIYIYQLYIKLTCFCCVICSVCPKLVNTKYFLVLNREIHLDDG